MSEATLAELRAFYPGLAAVAESIPEGVLMRSPGGVYKRANPVEELSLLAQGWMHHPPPGVSPKHGMANPDSEGSDL